MSFRHAVPTSPALMRAPRAQVVLWITRTMCGLSMCGALLIIFSFAVHDRSRNKTLSRVVLYLSVCDFLTALVYVLPNDTDLLCKSQALLSNFFAQAAFIYTDTIAVVICLTVCPWLAIRAL